MNIPGRHYSSLPEWLVKRANDGIFPLNVADLSNEFNEILQVYGQDADSIIEEDIRRRYCDLLLARQRDIEYLSCLNLHKVIAKHVRTSCRMAQAEETIESWINLDPNSAKLIELADEVANAIRAAWKVRTPPSTVTPKFSKELSLGSIDKFHHGLENLIGYPPTHSDFLSSMKREHEQAPFAGRVRTVDPKIEWNIVMQSESWNILGADCQPIIKITRRECTEPLEFYVNKALEKFAKADAIGDDVLNKAEVAALRLWTGPMHEKYAEVLRKPQNTNGPYVTTLHAINSGITKLARIWPIPVSRKVYRGYKNLRLQDLKKDPYNCVGGVENCVLATSEDFQIAVNYSADGAFILEIEVGQANRGADVSWLSQFPHEKEILFNALSNVEFVCSPQQRIVHFKHKHDGPGKILVYQVCLSANLKSKTLEQFVRLRKDLHLNLVEVLAQEALRTISMRESGSSHGLIKRLCEECSKHCEAICNEANDADVCIFNGGTPEYIRLVKDANWFKSRSETLIDLALGWFDYGKADPTGVDGLQGWQLKALRVAFKVSKRPKVTTVVLEQDRHVDSLFGAKSLSLGAVHKVDTVFSVAKLLSLNPELKSLEMEVASATAELWESVFNELCPDRPSLRVNGFHIAEYATSTLQQLELRNSGDQMATMIAPALLMHTPSALTSLNLYGTPIACGGGESLGRTFTGLQRLKYLDLRSCQIADRGCTGIAQTLFALSVLEELKLARNKVGDDGFNILASTIRAHGFTRLKSVDMRFNNTQLPSLLCGAQCVMKNHIVAKLSTNTRVSCVAWSPIGDQIASASEDNTIIIWDAKTGEQVSTLKGHTRAVKSVAWRPGGDQIVSGGYGAGRWDGDYEAPGEIIIWDAMSGNQVSTLKGHTDAVTSVSWRPGGDQIASGSFDGTIIIWDAKTGEQVSTLKGHTSEVTSVAWRPGGDQIVSGGYGSGTDTNSWELGKNPGEIIIWDSKSGDQLSKLKGHTAAVTSVAWRPGGDQIVSGCGYQMFGGGENEIIIWDTKTGDRISTLRGHTAAVMSVAWRPGGDQIASASKDKTIIIWDAKNGEQVSTLKGHTSCVTSVAWRLGGDQIASGSDDGTIIIWDANTGEQVSTLKGHSSGVNSVAWCPGGNQIVSGCGNPYRGGGQNEIIIWDAKTGDQISILKGHTAAVMSVAWRPGGDQIASGSVDSTIIIWDTKTGEQVSTLKGHTLAVMSVAWRPRGDQIASGAYDSTIIIWDTKTGEQVSTLKGHTSAVISVAWCPGGDQIASGSYDSTIIIWDAKTGEHVSTLKGHGGTVTSVAWRPGSPGHPGGDQIASGSWDNAIIIWDAKTGEQVSTLKGHASAVMSVAWRPGGDQIVSGGKRGLWDSDPGEIIIWDARTGEQVSKLKGHTAMVTSVAWRPGGDQIASGSDDSTIIIWDAKTGEQVSTLKGHTKEVTSVAWSPVTDQIVSGSNYNTIIIWDAKTGNQMSTLKGHSGPVYSVGWSANGDRIASGSADQTIVIWDAKSGDLVSTLKGHSGAGEVKSVAWSPSGQHLASVSDDKTVIVWDVNTGAQISQLKGHSDTVLSVAWSASGEQVISGSADKTVIVWDAKMGVERLKLEGHTGAITSVACSSGGQVACDSTEGTVIVWDGQNGERKTTLIGHSGSVEGVAWSPSGDKIVTACSDQSLIVWDAESGKQISTLQGQNGDVASMARSLSGTHVASNQREAESGAAWQGNTIASASEEATIRAGSTAISASGEEQAAHTEEGCMPPPAKKKKTG